MKKKWRPFEEARKFVRSLDLKKENEWRVYCKSGKKPADIPATPGRVYENKGWTSMGDWLGTGYVANQKRQYRPFKEARKFAQSLKLKSRKEWDKLAVTGNLPNDIPSNPYNAYKKEFQGMGDFLGTGNVATKEFWSFEKAREYVQNLGLKNNGEWEVFRKSSRRPEYIPTSPQRTYKEEFVSVGDWLGTGTVAPQVRSKLFLPPIKAKIEARKVAKKLGIKTREQWIEAYRAGEIPNNIPRDLYKIYGPKRRRK